MSTLEYIIIFTLIGSVGSLIGGIALLSREKFALKISHFLASFAAGVLLGTAFFDLLPEASHEAEGKNIDIYFWTLLGIVLFFFIERFIHWFHHHDESLDHQHAHESTTEQRHETKSTIPLIIIGDTIHNFLDGIVIAATFMISIPLGIVTTLAVAAHEIPQEIGDFGLMLHKGLSKKRIILVNVLSALASLVAAIMTYMLGDILGSYIAVFLALTAGFFIYIASSDLIPEIHYEKRKPHAIAESILLVVGIAVVMISVSLLEHGH
jgi:zinc and cadmium transporter